MAMSHGKGSISLTGGFATSTGYPTSIPRLWAKPLDFVFLQSRPGAWASVGTVNITVSFTLRLFPRRKHHRPCVGFPSYFFFQLSRAILFSQSRSLRDADRNFLFLFLFHNRNTQIAGSAPPHRPKPNSSKITFVRPIIKLRSGRSTPLGWLPSSLMVRPKGRTGRVTMRKMSLRDPNLVLHPSATRSIFQPRPKAPFLPKRRLPRQEACWLRPRLSLPERCPPRPRLGDTRFRTSCKVAHRLRRPF